MPLPVNKSESKSIEDLIAQLDAPPPPSSSTTSASANANNDNDQTSGDRKILRGKRTNSGSNSGNGGSQPTIDNSISTSYYDPVLNKNIIISKKYSKNLKSSAIKGRGLPKKGGAGGKGTWGAPGCELNSYNAIDKDDPNYDSEDAGNVVMVCAENNETHTTDTDGGGAGSASAGVSNKGLAKPQLEIDDFDQDIKLIILEYYQNGDTVEVIDQLNCYTFNKIKAQLLTYIMQLALEQNNTCKELTSRLLRDFHMELFSTADFESAFDLLIKNLNDLTLDNPDASKTIGTLIARCIADKILTTDYIGKNSNYNNNDENENINQVMEHAKSLTNRNHLFHLSHIWGHNQGGFTAVKDLTDKINTLIQEYYNSGDINEAIQCLKELNVPHFNHEFIYEALDFSLQKGDDHAIDLITNLLKKLCDTVVITYDQLKIGFTRVYDLLPDICLDVPNAYTIIDNVINVCLAKGVINNDIADLAPNRSRKRFVSEGDGGRFKDETVHN